MEALCETTLNRAADSVTYDGILLLNEQPTALEGIDSFTLAIPSMPSDP